MKTLASIIAILLLTTPAFAAGEGQPAPSGVYRTDPAHTSLTWRIGHFGLSNYTARFTTVSADLVWNAEQPERSTVKAQIAPASIRTDFPFPEKENFDGKIGTDPAFLAGSPILFTSKAIQLTGDKTGLIAGDLTFRGVTKPVTLEVTFNGSMRAHPVEKMAKIGFSAVGKIKRSDWGLDFALPALSDEVSIVIETEFAPAT